MAVKTTLTLDNKLSYDLLVETVRLRREKIAADLTADRDREDRMPRNQYLVMEKQILALDDLLKIIT